MTDSVIRSWVTRIEDYHTVYIMPNAKFTKTASIPRALQGDEWHPLIPSPLGERVRVRGEGNGHSPPP